VTLEKGKRGESVENLTFTLEYVGSSKGGGGTEKERKRKCSAEIVFSRFDQSA